MTNIFVSGKNIVVKLIMKMSLNMDLLIAVTVNGKVREY